MNLSTTLEVYCAFNVYKPQIADQKPEKMAQGGQWAVTDAEGLIMSTWPTRQEAEHAAYALYKGISPSSTGATAGARVKRVRDIVQAGGEGSGCRGSDCGRKKVSFEKALSELPKAAEVSFDPMYHKTVGDLVALAEHELNLYHEGEPETDIRNVRDERAVMKFVKKWKTDVQAEEEEQTHKDIFQDQELNDQRRRGFMKRPKPRLVKEADELRMGDRRPSSHGQGSAGTGGAGGPSGI